MKYFKKFDTHTQYQSYIISSEKQLPNVSYCKEQNELHFNPYFLPILFCNYDPGTEEIETLICNKEELGDLTTKFKKIIQKGSVDDPYYEREYSISQLNEDNGYIHNLAPYNADFYFIFKNENIIPDNAFDGCSSIINITIPKGIEQINSYAFSSCSFTNVQIPNTVRIVDEYAFSRCERLEIVTLSSAMTQISSGLFEGCIKLQNIKIPNNITKIGTSAFAGCTELMSINIPSSVTEIGDNVFANCTQLQYAVFNSSTPPTVGTTIFKYPHENFIIYVPTGCVAAYESVFNGYTIQENPGDII